MEAIVFIIHQMIFSQHARFWKLRNTTRLFPSSVAGEYSATWYDTLRSIARQQQYLVDYDREYNRKLASGKLFLAQPRFTLLSQS